MVLMNPGKLDFAGTLGTGLSATTNPDPNTLGVVNPFTNPYTGKNGIIQTWLTQSATNGKALFPKCVVDPSGGGDPPIRFACVPSAGASTTYTLKIWFYLRTANTWVTPAINPTYSYTGNAVDIIDNPGGNPIYLEIDAISSGTLSIYYDNDLAEAY